MNAYEQLRAKLAAAEAAATSNLIARNAAEAERDQHADFAIKMSIRLNAAEAERDRLLGILCESCQIEACKVTAK